MDNPEKDSFMGRPMYDFKDIITMCPTTGSSDVCTNLLNTRKKNL